MNSKSIRGLLMVQVIAVALAGCATGRDVLDVRVQVPANPVSTQGFVITDVVDNRVFEESPSSRDIPSLRDDDIANPEATSRAIARKGNTFGAAMGDIVLPEGRTVSDVVRDAITAALREEGYAVYSSGSVDAQDALALNVTIEKFWAWFEPGFARITLAFAGDVAITPDPSTNSGVLRLQAETETYGQAATMNNWLEAFEAGINALMDEFKAQLRDES